MAFSVTVSSGPTAKGPKQIVQRTRIGGGADGVEVAGTYAGATIGMDFQIECRIVDDGTSNEVVGWTRAYVKQIDGRTGSGAFTVAFPGEVPIGGWYNLQFRASARDFAVQTANHTVKWGVGILFFLIGQSNVVKLYTEASSPAAADAKIGAYLNSTPSSYAGAKAFEWLDLTVDAMGNGIHQLLNDMQAGLTEDGSGYGDIPVGLIGAGVGAAGLTHFGDWQFTGTWQKGDPKAYDAAMSMLALATGKTTVEGVIWQQGEAEATKYADPLDPGKWLSPGEYLAGLKSLYEALSGDLQTPHEKLKMVFSGPCRNTQTWSQVTAVVNFVLASPRVNSDLLRFVKEDPAYRGFAGAARGAIGADGLHLTAAGAATLGGDLANSMLEIMGVATTNPRPGQGPRITGAYFGTEAAPDDHTKLTLMIEHDKGTTLVLGTDSSITAFQVFDAAGPLAVTAAAVHADGDKIELTLSSDTTQTAGLSSDPYSRPNRLVGNWAAVKYATWPSLDPVFFIKDNATVPGYLRPTSRDETSPAVAAPVIDAYQELAESFIKAKITASSAVGGKTTVTIDTASLWEKSAGSAWRRSGLLPLQIKPGDQVTLQSVIGGYKGDSIVEQVVATSPWQVKLVDDFNGATIETTGGIEDRLFVNPEPESSGALLVKRRVATYLKHGE